MITERTKYSGTLPDKTIITDLKLEDDDEAPVQYIRVVQRWSRGDTVILLSPSECTARFTVKEGVGLLIARAILRAHLHENLQNAVDALPERLPRATDENGDADQVNLRDFIVGHLFTFGIEEFVEED